MSFREGEIFIVLYYVNRKTYRRPLYRHRENETNFVSRVRKFTNLNNQKNALPENMSESHRIGSSSVRANMNTFNFELC